MKATALSKLAIICLLAATFSACDRNDSAERVGETMDRSAENMGDKIENSVENAGDKMENAGDRIEDKTD